MRTMIMAIAVTAALSGGARDTAIYNGKLTSPLNANGMAITNAAAPVAATDVATKGYVDTIGGVTPSVVTNIASVAVTNNVAAWAMKGMPEPSGGVTNVFTNGVSAVAGKVARITIPSTNGFVTASVTNGLCTAVAAQGMANAARDQAKAHVNMNWDGNYIWLGGSTPANATTVGFSWSNDTLGYDGKNINIGGSSEYASFAGALQNGSLLINGEIWIGDGSKTLNFYTPTQVNGTSVTNLGAVVAATNAAVAQAMAQADGKFVGYSLVEDSRQIADEYEITVPWSFAGGLYSFVSFDGEDDFGIQFSGTGAMIKNSSGNFFDFYDNEHNKSRLTVDGSPVMTTNMVGNVVIPAVANSDNLWTASNTKLTNTIHEVVASSKPAVATIDFVYPTSGAIPNNAYMGALTMSSFTANDASGVSIGSGAFKALPYLKKVRIEKINSSGLASDAFSFANVEELYVGSCDNASSAGCPGAAVRWDNQGPAAFGLDKGKIRKVHFPFGQMSVFSFSWCTNLEEVTGFNANTKFHGYSCFQNCKKLKRVDLTGLTGPLYGTFDGCSSLESVGDTSGFSAMGNAFSGCSSLTGRIDLASCTQIEQSFKGCGHVIIDNVGKINSISLNCFANSTLEFNDCNFSNVTAMTGLDVFRNSQNVTNHLRFASLKTLGSAAVFRNASCKSMIIPSFESDSSVVGGQTFNYCYKCEYIGPCTNNKSSFTQFYNSFLETGKDISSTDPDGNEIGTVVEIRCLSCDEILGLSYFPFDAPNKTKFVGNDGYIVYKNGTWTPCLYSAGYTNFDYYQHYEQLFEQQQSAWGH